MPHNIDRPLSSSENSDEKPKNKPLTQKEWVTFQETRKKIMSPGGAKVLGEGEMKKFNELKTRYDATEGGRELTDKEKKKMFELEGREDLTPEEVSLHTRLWDWESSFEYEEDARPLTEEEWRMLLRFERLPELNMRQTDRFNRLHRLYDKWANRVAESEDGLGEDEPWERHLSLGSLSYSIMDGENLDEKFPGIKITEIASVGLKEGRMAVMPSGRVAVISWVTDTDSPEYHQSTAWFIASQEAEELFEKNSRALEARLKRLKDCQNTFFQALRTSRDSE